MNDENKLFWCIVGMLVIPFTIAWRGYALSVLWSWFIVGFGIRPIGVAEAIGLGIVVTALTHQKAKTDNETGSAAIIEALVYAVMFPAFALLYGAIIHAMM